MLLFHGVIVSRVRRAPLSACGRAIRSRGLAVGRVFARRRGFVPSCARFRWSSCRAVGRRCRGRLVVVRALVLRVHATRVAPVHTHPYARARGSFGVLPLLSERKNFYTPTHPVQKISIPPVVKKVVKKCEKVLDKC